MTTHAVISVLVKANGIRRTNRQLMSVNNHMKATAASGSFMGNTMATGMERAFGVNRRRALAMSGAMMAKQRQTMIGLGNTMRRVATGTGVVVGGLTAYGIKLNAQWESQQHSFATLLGSMSKAQRFTENLRKVSAESPLRLTEYAEGAKLLLGFGMNAKKVVPTLESVNKAIVATGQGPEVMMRVVRALGLIEGRGKATARELQMLTYANVPVQRILRKELKMTSEEVAEIGSSGKTASEVISAIARGWRKEYGPAYKDASETFKIQTAQMKKNFEQFLRLASEPLFRRLTDTALPKLNNQLRDMIDVLDNPRLTGEQKFERVVSVFEKWIAAAGRLGVDAIPKIQQAVGRLLPAFTRLMGQLTPLFADAMANMIAAGAKLLAKGGAKLAGAFIKGFVHSGSWGRLVLATWLFSKLGGFAAIRAAGAQVGVQAAVGVQTGMMAGMGAGGAAGGAAMAGGVLGWMKNVKWARVGAIGLGLTVADTLMTTISNRTESLSDDLLEAMTSKAEKGRWYEGITVQALGLSSRSQAAGWVRDTLEQLEEGRTRLADSTWAREFLDLDAFKEAVDLTEEQEKMMGHLFDLARASEGLGVGVSLDMDPKKLQRIQNTFQNLRQGVFRTTKDIRDVSKKNLEDIADQFGKNTAEGRKLTRKNLRATARAFAINMARSGKETDKGLRHIGDLLRKADLVKPTENQAAAMATAWARGFADSGKITEKGISGLINKMKLMPKPMRQIAWDTFWPIIQEAQRSGKLSDDAVKDLRGKVSKKFRDLKTNAVTSSKNTADGVIDNFRRANRVSGEQIDDLLGKVDEGLRKLGIRDVGFNVGGRGGGRAGRQKGGVVPGAGVGDKVPMTLPTGSYILNRKATGAFGFASGGKGVGNVLLEPGERVFLPGEVKSIGQSKLESMNRSVPRFQEGGPFGNSLAPTAPGLRGLGLPPQITAMLTPPRLKRPVMSGTDPLRAMGQKAIDLIHKAGQKKLKAAWDSSTGGLGSAPGALGMLERIGNRMGLQTTSGHRPGDPGWHGKNRARDLSDGVATPTEYRFGMLVARVFGKRMLELIHTPLGFGIKNGQRVAPYAQAAHYDHVHIAMKRGGLLGALQALASGGWVKTGYTTYSGSGGSWGILGSKPAYAELGTATSSGAGTGTGYMARALGMRGELPKNFPVDVKIGQRKGRLYKQDRGYGQGTPAYSIDVHTSGFGQVGLRGHSKGTAFIRAAGGSGSGGGNAQARAAAQAEQRATSRAARIARLRKRAAKAKTPWGRKSALWQLVNAYTKWGDFGSGPTAKRNVAHLLKEATGISGVTSPNAGVARLARLSKWLRKHIKLTGNENSNKSLTRRLTRAKKRGAKQAQRARKRISKRISKRGLNYKGKQGVIKGQRQIEILQELIDRMERLHTAPGSAPGGEFGTELTDAEVLEQVGINTQLHDRLRNQRSRIRRSEAWIGGYIKRIQKLIAKNRKRTSVNRWRVPAWRKTIKNAREGRRDLRAQLDDIQGKSGKSGLIFDVKMKLNELGYTKTWEKSQREERDSQRADNLQEMLRMANLRADTLSRQMSVINTLPTYMGAFAKGGVAMVGEKGPELAHLPSGTRIHSAADTRSMLAGRGGVTIENLSVTVFEDGSAEVTIDDKRIEAVVERVNRRNSRRVGAVPGGRR